MSGEKQRYAVVRFEDAVVSEIPTKWLIDNNTKCWWPPTRNVSTHISKETNPTEDWKKYPIQIETFCDSLAVARKKAEDINYTESEEIPTGRGHRRRNNATLIEQDVDSSDTDHDKRPTWVGLTHGEGTHSANQVKNYPGGDRVAMLDHESRRAFAARTLEAPPRLNEDISISSTGRPPLGSSVVQQIDDSALPSRNIQAISDEENTSSNNITKNPPNTIVIPSTSEQTDCRAEDSSALNKIWKALSEIQLKLNDLGEMLDANGQFTRVDAHEPIKRFLPIKDLEALAQFEEHLSEEDNRKLFESYIKMIGGNGLKDSISRAYKSTFTNEAAVLCSWLGLRKNHRISDSKAINIIKDILMLQFNTNNNHCSVKDFEVISSEWFRHARQRLNRQK